MINLIPNEEKKKKVRDFYFRLAIVFSMVMSISILISSVAILPSYLLFSAKRSLSVSKLETQKNEAVPLLDQKTLSDVNDLKSKLELVEKNKQNKYLVSEQVINEIVLKKMFDIEITKIFYDNSTNKGKIITINGMAPSRERLLLFRNILLDNIAFKKVDLPISNFIKGSNIQFSLTLIPA